MIGTTNYVHDEVGNLISIRVLSVIDEAVEILPFGKQVYLPALPNHPLVSNLDIIARLHKNGFAAVPHIAAKRLCSKEELEEFLKKVVHEYGVQHVLLIGGDIDESIGPFNDAAAVLKDGVLQQAGIKEVGLAAYPEGHPRIKRETLIASLQEKLNIIKDSGMGAYIVTQFSFVPARIVELCRALNLITPNIPVYVGMAGPTDTKKLLAYAKLCGVSASLRVLTNLGFKAAKLVTNTEPNDQLSVLGRYCASRDECNVIGIHIFSFGGYLGSARWMNEKLIQTNGSL